MRAVGRRAAHAVVGENAGRPGFLKRVELKPGVLVSGADQRVSDDGHCHSLCLIIPSKFWVLILEVMRRVFKTSDRAVEPGSGRADERDVWVASTHRFRDWRTPVRAAVGRRVRT